MNELDAALAEVTTGLAELSKQVGPEAVEAVLRAVRFGAILNLFGLLSFVLLALLFAFLGFKLLNDKEAELQGAGAAIGLGGCLFALISFVALLSSKHWISAFDPAAGLAWRLLEKL